MNLYDEFHESWHPVIDKWESVLLKKINRCGTIYPPKEFIFRVFQMPLEDIKVVILGQDPYHGAGQAMGLAFSCNENMKLQPSLRNIFKELCANFPKRKYKFITNDLSRWHNEEGIFLFNVALIVRESEPGSFLSEWRNFANAIIKYISDYNEKCVFLLMGKPAQNKGILIEDKTRIIECTHPSPLSAHGKNGKGAFFGSKVFEQIENKIGKINWES